MIRSTASRQRRAESWLSGLDDIELDNPSARLFVGLANSLMSRAITSIVTVQLKSARPLSLCNASKYRRFQLLRGRTVSSRIYPRNSAIWWHTGIYRPLLLRKRDIRAGKKDRLEIQFKFSLVTWRNEGRRNYQRVGKRVSTCWLNLGGGWIYCSIVSSFRVRTSIDGVDQAEFTSSVELSRFWDTIL